MELGNLSVFEQGEKSKAAISYQRPQEKRVLLLCYILLLCLMINDYDVEISRLALEFQLEPKDLSLYFRCGQPPCARRA